MKWLRSTLIAMVSLLGIVFVGGWLLGYSYRAIPREVPGYQVIQIAVSHRKTPVRVHLWYPTDENSAPVLVGQNALFYGHYVHREAKPSGNSLPVVLLSHGSGGNAERLGWLASEIANRGMIVAAPDHPGTTSGDSDPFQTVKVWERPQDLSAVLDYLASNSNSGLKPDMNRVGVVGFSLGGFSALSISGVRVSKAQFIDYCNANRGQLDCGWMQAAGVDFNIIDRERYEQSNLDHRIKATVAVDPALPAAIVKQSLATIDRPTLIINLGDPEKILHAMRVDALTQKIKGAIYVPISGAHHFSFMAECSWLGFIVIGITGEDNICSDVGFRNRGLVHRQSKSTITDFLVKELVAN